MAKAAGDGDMGESGLRLSSRTNEQVTEGLG